MTEHDMGGRGGVIFCQILADVICERSLMSLKHMHADGI